MTPPVFTAPCGGHCGESDVEHGTHTGYRTHECRCSACVAWYRANTGTLPPQPRRPRGLTGAQRAARAGIVYPPAGAGKYPVVCRKCGWSAAFFYAVQRRKKAWAHVQVHELNDFKDEK